MNHNESSRSGIWAVVALCALAVAMCVSALLTPSDQGGRHEAPRVNPGSVAVGAGSRILESGAPARPAWKAEATSARVRRVPSRVTAGERARGLVVLDLDPENADTETRPKLLDDLGRALRAPSQARTGASRWRDFAGERETSCTLVVEQSAHRPEFDGLITSKEGSASSIHARAVSERPRAPRAASSAHARQRCSLPRSSRRDGGSVSCEGLLTLPRVDPGLPHCAPPGPEHQRLRYWSRASREVRPSQGGCRTREVRLSLRELPRETARGSRRNSGSEPDLRERSSAAIAVPLSALRATEQPASIRGAA